MATETVETQELATEEQNIEAQAAALKAGEPDTVKADEGEAAESTDKPETDEVKALKAELKRVRKLNSERSDEVQSVKERLAKMEGQLEAGNKADGAKTKLASYSDRDLVRLQLQWEDQRDKFRSSEDAEGLEKARQNLEVIRVELHERSTTSATKASEAKADEEAILTEAATLIQNVLEAWPELSDEDSAIFKASQAEMQSKPRLYKQLGVFADAVAVTAALGQDPKLLGDGREKAARKKVVKEIEKAAETALHAGGGSGAVKTSVNVDNMSTDDIEAAAARLKAGGTLTGK